MDRTFCFQSVALNSTTPHGGRRWLAQVNRLAFGNCTLFELTVRCSLVLSDASPLQREVELTRVINKAHADLEENNKIKNVRV